MHSLCRDRILSYLLENGGTMEEVAESERGRCPVCGKVLPAGRTDMRFCSVRCKSRWHYLHGGDRVSYRRKVVRALERNYRILEGLLERGVTSIEIPDLARHGYDFSCITSYHKVGNHHEYRCFDIKYYLSASRVFRLERSPSANAAASDPRLPG